MDQPTHDTVTYTSMAKNVHETNVVVVVVVVVVVAVFVTVVFYYTSFIFVLVRVYRIKRVNKETHLWHCNTKKAC